MKNAEILDKIPEGWQILKGATTAPSGFIWIWNVKSRFGGEYRAALVPSELIKNREVNNNEKLL